MLGNNIINYDYDTGGIGESRMCIENFMYNRYMYVLS